MSSYSKSLFTNNTVFSNERSLFNPISFAIAVQTIGTGTSQELEFLTQYYIGIIRLIQTDYSSKIANQTYESIPTDFSQYTNLVKEVQEMRSQTTNASVLLLLQIAEDTLRGAFNSLSLYGDNLLLQLDKADLQKQVADILSDKNVTSIQSSMSTNNMTLTQSFQLAPVFNYYIRIYGAPLQGQGFDPVKVAFLIYTLQENGVDPYS
tara:strand:- start:11032 stop:11652 length:621 start_codon:yes stop_codon:yes gene_type:complete